MVRRRMQRPAKSFLSTALLVTFATGPDLGCATPEGGEDIDNGVESNRVWAIRLWDDDGVYDDAINTVCEPNDAGGCTYLPLESLQWGTVTWPHTPDWPYEVVVRFLALAE